MSEIWKDIVGYKGIYQVSNLGRIRGLDRLTAAGHKWKGKILKPAPDGYGYLLVTLCNGKQKSRTIHQLVCESFIGPCPEGKQICHGANGKLDNSVFNLSYGTRSKNQQDRFRDGTHDGIAVIRGDGREFISASEAARESGSWPQLIVACCRNKRKTTNGHTWRYKDENR